MATEFDVGSITSRTNTRLSSKIAWNQLLLDAVAFRLNDSYSEELAYLANYFAYLVRENKWGLARNISSLLAYQDIHRYQAHRKISATGILRISLDESLVTVEDWDSLVTYTVGQQVAYKNKYWQALTTTTPGLEPDITPAEWVRVDVSHINNIVIPKYAIFSNNVAVSYLNIANEQLLAGDDYVDINILQGDLVTFNTVATGITNEEFQISNDSIENSFFEVTVNSVVWENVNSLLLEASDSESYELENFLDFSGVFLKFGNDNFGKKLVASDVVEFNYIQSLGYLGNTFSKNLVTTVDSPIVDILNNPVTVFCSNLSAVFGGQNEESLEEIRNNAPFTFQTGDRATSANDYKIIIIDNFTYVLKITVWGSYEINIDAGGDPWDFLPLEENRVYISIVTQSLQPLTTPQKLAISEQLNQYKAPTDIVTYEDAKIIRLVFNTSAFIQDKSYTLNEVRTNIDNDLDLEYSIENREFFESVRFSDYQALIDNVEGVDYHNTTVRVWEEYYFDVNYDFSVAALLFPITPSSIKVYVQDIITPNDEFLIGTDDGIGNIVAEPGYDLTGSGINYTTGIGSILSTPLSEPYTNYRIRLEYTIDDQNITLKERYHIVDYDQTRSVITAQYIS
jgi:hypothetical protein